MARIQRKKALRNKKVDSSFSNSQLKKRTISVLGLGHVGLPTALGFAELGWEIVCADSDPAKVALIQRGRCPFFEPGLQEMLEKHLRQGTLKPTGDIDLAIRSSEILFLCVGTPQRDNGQADLSQVETLARTIACNLNGYKLIVEKSTVPAITAQWIKKTILRYAGAEKSRPDFDIASNPEFLREGKALQDFFHPDRIVCGVETEKAGRILEDIYQPLGCPIVMTDLTTSELIKHAANAFLCTKISFINMVADLCEAVGADITSLTRGIGLDHRIGLDFLQAGVGFGGYCFPKDLKAFIYLAEEHGADFSLLKQVERVNQRRIEMIIKKVQRALWVIREKRIGVLGLAFKAGTDDIREAPSLKIIEQLRREDATLRLYDPCAMPNAKKVLAEGERLAYCGSAYEAAKDADALLILTEWDEFLGLDLSLLRSAMAVPTIIDGRNLFDPQAMQKAGFEYFSVGRSDAVNPGLLSEAFPEPTVLSLEHARARPGS
ncbi:MAG: UDP-glucose/GDP-mannose dehydrogenase family protein [Acidobacteria bacterium]|nr:MAG: UDP-glucose/GDP-mannose dehydrogenase family protein [Acidobacteriota bacterium]